jgi:carotenoid 1,2-hydratase
MDTAQKAGAGGLFNVNVPSGGYAWWYLDAMSEDGNHALTVIAFIGSVFSPYYAWAGRSDPMNHCALNIALYGRGQGRWAMTERGRSDVDLSADHFRIGPSAIYRDGEDFVIEVAELGMPLPLRVRGRIRIRPRSKGPDVAFPIDSGRRHMWRPVAPAADIDVRFSSPDLCWHGPGYFDTNHGTEPLEDRFRYWDWMRLHLDGGDTLVAYTTDERGGPGATLALRFSPDGSYHSVPPLKEQELRPTPVFRVRRRAHAEASSPVRLGRTLEDTPFYSRSVVETCVNGRQVAGVHESFNGDRLKSGLVKLMLPFRMARRAGTDKAGL